MRRWQRRPKDPNAPKVDYSKGPFDSVRVFMSRTDRAKLKEYSELTGLPMSRLMAIAFDNELDQPVPFNYPCILPLTQYIEGAYTDEAGKLLRFLGATFPDGTGRDMLMLCRREIGIDNRETFMLAYRELLEMGLIEEVSPPLKTRGDWPAGYKFAVVKGESEKQKSEVRDKKRQIADLQKQIKQLEES